MSDLEHINELNDLRTRALERTIRAQEAEAALASAQAENERLREALKKTYAALKAVVGMLREHPAMQGREHVDLGIQANAALNQSERVLAALSNTDGGEG